MRKERLAAMALHRECAGRGDWLYEYDHDKCGSEYTFLPSPRSADLLAYEAVHTYPSLALSM
eukprot:2117077-Pleurochrysis_carterae.AAC.1